MNNRFVLEKLKTMLILIKLIKISISLKHFDYLIFIQIA